jgi:hypothetical protein
MSNIEMLAVPEPGAPARESAVSLPKPQSEAANLLYGLGYVIGAVTLAIPPVGILIILMTYRAHKKYRATHTPPAGS